MRYLTTAVLLVMFSLCVLGCEESSESSDTEQTSSSEPLGGLREEPTSLLGKTADMARDLQAQSEGRSTGGAIAFDSVEAAGFVWTLPEGWKAVEPSNQMRLAQLEVVKPMGGCVTTVTVAGGGVDANLARWGQQMLDDTGSPHRPTKTTREIDGMPVHEVEMTGTYRDGGMMRGPVTERPFWGMRGAVIETGDSLVFVKMTGPEDAMRQAKADWVSLLDEIRRP